MLKRIFTLILCLSITLPSVADEGMWLLLLLGKKYEDMKKLGLKLTPEEIYSVNNSSLKDAVVRMGRGFCTGEIISKEGLILTNHHCAYSNIQKHSTPENDYLSNGFWAMDRSQEKPNDGLTISFLVRIEDVTEKVLAEITDGMSEAERGEKIKAAFTKIKTDVSNAEKAKGNEYEVDVKSFFGGNEFYMLVYETYRDVRLVGAPPESIGKYGGDTDNWMWPRHTGDFALFRVYADKNGKPADYSPDNVPLQPRHHFPVSLKGVQEKDFAMVFGFPGSTDRYLTSFGVKQATETAQPTHVKIRGAILDIMKKYMDADKATRIKYASKYASIANYWKYFIGQTQGLKRLKVYEQKQAEEKAFTNWVKADATRQTKYADALADVKAAYEASDKTIIADTYIKELLLYGNLEAVLFSYQFNGLMQALSSGNKEGIDQQKAALKESIETHFKDYDARIDEEVFAKLSEMMDKNVKGNKPSYLRSINTEYNGDYAKYAKGVYASSIFTNKERLEAFLANPELEKAQNDPIFGVLQSFIQYYSMSMGAKQGLDSKLNKGNRLYIAGLRQMQPDKVFYPNANSTPRLTYGSVGSYNARDAVNYQYFTTLEGVIEKEDPNNPEFIVPQKLIDLHRKKDYGQYGENGKLPVCFISNNDITGGNSGSPVINGEGHIIGCAFDGNWEAMSGDIAFEPNLQRCISVDIRYILFIIDKFAGAGHLVEEMTLIKADAKPMKNTQNTNTSKKKKKKKGKKKKKK